MLSIFIGTAAYIPREKKLFDFITNVGCLPIFVGPGRRIIDLTICTSKLLELIRGSGVLDEVSPSNHRCLQFSVTIAVRRKYNIMPWRNLRKMNWAKFNEISANKVLFSRRLRICVAIEDQMETMNHTVL